LLGLQMAAGLAVAAGLFVTRGRWEASSAAYGSAISVLMTVLLSSGVALAGRAAGGDPGRSQAFLYAGAAVRFVLVLALFGAGLAGLGLAPFPTVIGFVVAQLMVPLAALGQRGDR
jgi:hypothetical protein